MDYHIDQIDRGILKFLQKDARMAYTEIAKKLGVSTQYLCDLEHDRKIVSPKKAKNFAIILGYSQEQFIALAIQDSLEHDGIHLLVQLKAA